MDRLERTRQDLPIDALQMGWSETGPGLSARTGAAGPEPVAIKGTPELSSELLFLEPRFLFVSEAVVPDVMVMCGFDPIGPELRYRLPYRDFALMHQTGSVLVQPGLQADVPRGEREGRFRVLLVPPSDRGMRGQIT